MRPDLAFVWFQSLCQTTASVKIQGCLSVTSSVRLALEGHRQSSKASSEHMEEDDTTPKALPDWVELEYNVNDVYSYAINDSNLFPCSI